MEGAVSRLVSDYTRSPVRLAFGSTLKPSENVRLQAFEVAENGKPEMLQNLLDKEDRKSTRLNSSHGYISYAVFCLKKKNTTTAPPSATFSTSRPRPPPTLVNYSTH